MAPSKSKAESTPAPVTSKAPKPVTRQPRFQEPVQPKWGIDPDKKYHYREVAALCGVTETRAIDWIYRSGLLAYIQLPRGRRVIGADLIAFLERNYVPPTEQPSNIETAALTDKARKAGRRNQKAAGN